MRINANLLVSCLALLTTAAMLLGEPALSHGDAWWIMAQPSYIDAKGQHCCGPSDCEPVPARVEIIERSDGILVNGHLLPHGQRGIYWSRDDRWWVCIDPMSRKPKCVFRPQPVM